MRAIYITAILATWFLGASTEFGSPALAQSVSGSSSGANIAEFLSDPAKLLSEYPDGGEGLVTRIRDLATSDPSALGPLIQLLATANSSQTNAIGTALGQAALAVVKTNPTYANTIQSALIAATDKGHVGSASDLGSAQPKIGKTVSIKDDVKGTTEKGTRPLFAGNEVYLDEQVRTGTSGKAEFLFADRTNLTVGPVTEIKLDHFVYNPGADGNVVVVASSGAFRFITGIQPHEDYTIKTPYATMGVRGTEFIVSMAPNEEAIQLGSGEVIVTTISNQVVSLNVPGTVLLVDSYGNTRSQPPTNQPIVNFADLGPPVTNTQLADALSSFSAVTGNSSIGAGSNGGGGGGEGGGGEGGGAGGLTSPAGGIPGTTPPINVGTGPIQTADTFQAPTLTISTPLSFSSVSSSTSPSQ